MYNIAIIDDDSYDLERTKSFVLGNGEYSSAMRIYSYCSGFDFLAEKKVAFDLIFLDMQMAFLSGFETAKELRKINSKAVLCFCSAVIFPQTEHFEVEPFRYIIKNDSSEKIQHIVTDLLLEMKRRKKEATVSVLIDGAAAFIPTNDILYFEKQKHALGVILSERSPLYKKDAKVLIHKKLLEVLPLVQDEGFAIPHSSFLVNIKKVLSLSSNGIIMENGARLPLSRSCKEQFQADFAKHFSSKY